MTLPALLDRAACDLILRPYVADLEGCFQRAWVRWNQWLHNIEGSPADISPRSRANCLYDLIASEAAKTFLDRPHVRVQKIRGFLVLSFDGSVAMRFKKFRGKSLKTSGVRTHQATLFDSHQLEGTNVQPLTHVVAGYLLDDLDRSFARLAVTCTMNGDQYWAPIEMMSAEADAQVVPVSRSTGEGPKPVVRSTRRSVKEFEAGDTP